MKFWDSIWEYQIDSIIEREELEFQQALYELRYYIGEGLGMFKLLNWIINKLEKLMW